ncbi:MAG: acyl carrier protein [Clostridia bacterium]|nr:acyl carrier protein [Clostridia bacterium]
MKRNEILTKLKDIVAAVKGVDAVALDFVTEDTTIKEDLGLNSIGVLYVVVAIEKAFGVDMQSGDYGDFETVADVVDHIEEQF